MENVEDKVKRADLKRFNEILEELKSNNPNNEVEVLENQALILLNQEISEKEDKDESIQDALKEKREKQDYV